MYSPEYRFINGFITDELILYYSCGISIPRRIPQPYKFIKYINAIYTERIVLLKCLQI